MKTVMIIRFGSPHPTKCDFIIMQEIDKLGTSIGAAFGNMGIISLVKTDVSPKRIAQCFTAAAEANDDKLPVVVAYPDEIGLDLSAMGMDQFIAEFEAKCQAASGAAEDEQPEPEPEDTTTKCTLSLDELLDLVSAKGVQGLSIEERERLQELSK